MSEMSIQTTVAVVDDDPSVLNATQVLLKAHGFTAIGFSSAEDFLGRDPATRIGCVLLDINLVARAESHYGAASTLTAARYRSFS